MQPEPPDMVTVFDGFGRRYEVSKDTWRNQVLPDALSRAWDDPDELAAQVILALRDDLAADVLDAATRLFDIDRDPGRGGVLLGVCLLETGDLPDAERVLREVVDRAPGSAAAWTNLAKIADRRGADEEVSALLHRARDADPDYEQAIIWYAARERDRHGPAAWVTSMAEAARKPGAWRPQLWLGRAALEDDDVHGALAWYRQALDRAPDEPDALMMATGDLGKAGELDALLALGLPRWRPAEHGLAAGMNLAEAALRAQRVDEASDVLHRLYALELPHLREQLRPLADRLDALRHQRAAALRADVHDASRLAVSVLGSTDPVWWRALAQPTWLLRPAAGRARVAFLPLWAHDPGATEVEVQQTEWRGRVARGTPLYLADEARRQAVAAATVQPVVADRGMVLTGSPFHAEQIRQMLDAAEVRADFVLTGSIRGTDQHPAVELVLLDGTGERELAVIGPTSLDRAWTRLAGTLSGLGIPVTETSTIGGGRVPSVIASYEMVLTSVLTARGVMPADTLWGERATLDWLLDLCAADPTDEWPTVLYLAALVANRGYGSPIFTEYRQRTNRLFDDRRGLLLHDRLRPLLYALFDAQPVPDPTGDTEYDTWLERLRDGFWYGP